MSGIVGIVRTDDAPVSADLISTLTDSLAFRGPDGRSVWRLGPVAFGHTSFQTVADANTDRQPFSVSVRGDDGAPTSVTIVADARIDARAELIRRLDSAGEEKRLLSCAPDVELILRAYLEWGEACIDYLLGDFAFAIWDGRTRRLLCARDHVGVKPFYYARVGHSIVFSNTLECVLCHPDVPEQLDDVAVADFLLFGNNQNAMATTFRHVKRLPAAHVLTWHAGRMEIRRYWSLPIDEPVYYRTDLEYIDRFNALLRDAVTDRLRGQPVGVFMSGGVDSPLLAAVAKKVAGEGDAVHAHTFVYGSLVTDTERRYAAEVGQHLRVPVSFYLQDERVAWSETESQRFPEPTDNLADGAAERRCYADMAAHGRVAFYGEGPDNALEYEWQPHVQSLARQRRWIRLGRDVVKHIASHRRLPLLPTIPRMLRDRKRDRDYAPEFPAWIEPSLIGRLDLKERWRQAHATPASVHPIRPVGYASLMNPMWQWLFESLDQSYTGAQFEVRHPYMDIRLLRYMLAVPSMPWCRRKYLVRRAARGLLPPSVLVRDKTTLGSDPQRAQVERCGMPPVSPSASLRAYADGTMPSQTPAGNTWAIQADLRLVALSYWLRQRETRNRTVNGGFDELRREGIATERREAAL